MPGQLESPLDREVLSTRYLAIRGLTEKLCSTLEIEDYQLQSMPECSPPKWHLAHTAWFFETFILAESEVGFRAHNPKYQYLFNSYYEAVGERWPRPARGLLSRPTVAEVYGYRRSVDERMLALIGRADEPVARGIAPLVELGLQHEQQHQELLLTDLKNAFALNPIGPIFALNHSEQHPSCSPSPMTWEEHPSEVRCIGSAGDGFAFDNECPRHKVYVNGYQIASRPSTVGEFLCFVEDDGYTRPEFWLSDGWSARQKYGWPAPLYWDEDADGRSIFTLRGRQRIDAAEPVCHLSYYEADAFARWSGARLPTEMEWETAAADRDIEGNFLDSGRFHPVPDAPGCRFYGNVWRWTASPYTAYPGFRPAVGALGEYNAKFMCNQIVLRGGSCATPVGHVRSTYRNFFPPDTRWQFSGIQLARDLSE